MHSQRSSPRQRHTIRKSPLQDLAQQDVVESLPQSLIQQSIVNIKTFVASFVPDYFFHNYHVSDSEDDDALRTVGAPSEELSERAQHDRDFAPFRAISNDRFKAQLRKFLDPTNYFKDSRIRILRRTEGASHHVMMLQFGHPKYVMEYVFKIPVTGTVERWKEEHAYTMSCEALLIKYIKKHTNMPVPEIKEVDLGFDNELGAPYILMKKMHGKSAGYIWYEQGDGYALNADFPSELTLQKRETFLKSLAGYMAKLQTLEFDKIGMPICEDTGEPVVGHSWETVDGNWKIRHASASTQDYLMSGIEVRWPIAATVEDMSIGNNGEEQTEEDRVNRNRGRGMHKMINMIFQCPPFAAPEAGNERFVIRHPDLDLQNILTDEEGNVTGIIDWHEAVTAPRCVGPAALPLFLIKDWLPGFTLDDPPYLSWTVDYYLRIYAQAMQDACEDGKYTYKSAMYQAVYLATTRRGSAPDLVDKILLQLPGVRLTDPNEFLERLGRGWSAAEKYLAKEIRDLFDPITSR
ncbi:hypothetical protein Ptr902_12214 [Pyrenophora tritici-repentis]|nr:hypothetical protein L13192_07180 [Pyrenophora tritici-repentis]KAI2476335.1 hypothetical protein Ptr902_12214 [Pyrenophora tritici-repentis]